MYSERGKTLSFMKQNTTKIFAKEALNLIRAGKKFKVYPRDKNYSFIKKYGFSQKVIEEIIYELDEKNFIERIANKDPKIDTDYLYAFGVLLSINDEYGFPNTEQVYIKICSIKIMIKWC